MKRSLYHILYIAVLAWALTACSESEELASIPTSVKVSKIIVSPYPAFAENSQTRSVGTFDAGKTAWAEGDEILLMVGYTTGYEINIQHITLRYDGTEWNADKTINWLTTYTIASALYAPDWTFDTENILSFTLKENAQYGTSEFIEVGGLKLTNDSVLSIDFSNAKRSYNRLRIAGEASSTVNVAITNFRPFGTRELFNEYNYSLTTDEKGNAYLYGWWNADASLTITGTFDVNGTDKEITLFSRDGLPDTSNDYEGKKGYVADAHLNYKNEGDGTAENPYKISLPKQLAALATDVNNGTFTETEKHFALQGNLDLSDYEDWTPIGNTVHPFTGVFDGQGHTIRNLKIENNNPNNVKEWGLFGMVKDATIQSVKVDGSVMLSKFGDSDEGAEADMDGIGGIVGRCSGEKNNFYGCHSNVTIQGTAESNFVGVGGIVGFVKEGKTTLVACSNTSKISVDSKNWSVPVGGLIGRLRMTGDFTIHACYCYGEILSTVNGEEKKTGALLSGFASTVSGNPLIYIFMDAFYWSQVNGKPDALMQGISTDKSITGAYQIESSEWQTAKDAMNGCLSTNHPDFGYQYVENTGENAATVPLVLQAVTTNNNE